MRVAIYARVSTGEQTTENQKQELLQVAIKRDWDVTIFEDKGISGAKGRDKRPALDDMLRQATRGKFDLIAAWSVDRLGRSLSDLVNMLAELQSAGVGLYLHQQALDTTTPSGKAMFQMIGVFAEFERSIIQERIRAGLARARAAGKKFGAKTKVTSVIRQDVLYGLEMGESMRVIGKRNGISRTTVLRIKQEAEANGWKGL